MNQYKKIFVTTCLLMLTVIFSVTFLCTCKNVRKKNGEHPVVSTSNSKDTFHIRPLTNIKYKVTAIRLKQGKYLTTSILQCFTCHSPRHWNEPGAPPFVEKQGSGGTIVNQDSTSLIIAPNITPDKETGAGKWTDDMFARAIREGVGHDGRALSWQMPYIHFRNLSDEDLASIIVYLRSLPPVHNVVPPSKIPAEERSGTEKSLKPIMQPVLTPDFSDPKKRGKYLVSLGYCGGCHTAGTEYNPGLFAGGNLAHAFGRRAFTANITPDPSGISYGPEGFIFVLRTGKGGTLSPIMPWVAFKNMTDNDLKAIYAYLGTMPPSKHYVSNQLPFTHCAICGQEHGLGDKNKIEKPAGIKMDPGMYDQYAGTYLNEEYNATYIIAREGNKLIGREWENAPKVELIPQSKLNFLAPGWALPITFVKDKSGQVTQLAEDSDEGLIYKKIK